MILLLYRGSRKHIQRLISTGTEEHAIWLLYMGGHMLSIIVPVYNESRFISKTLVSIYEIMRRDLDVPFEIIVVNDGSHDDSAETIMRVLPLIGQARMISYANNKGKGFALQAGLRYCLGSLAAFIDADGEIDPSNLIVMYNDYKDSATPIIIGRKEFEGSRTLFRRTLTYLSKTLMHSLFRLPVHDTQTGIKLFEVETLRFLLDACQEDGYLFDLELLFLAHRAGLPMREQLVKVQMLRQSRVTAADAGRAMIRSLSLWGRLHTFHLSFVNNAAD